MSDSRLLRVLNERAGYERISGENDLRELEKILAELELIGDLPGDLARLNAEARAELARLAGSVVLLQAPNGSPATGFFVAPNLLLTNNHVLPDKHTAARFRARLRYERSDSPPVWCKLLPGRLFQTSRPLDYSLVTIDCPSAANFVSLAPMGVAKTNDSVIIVQHPNGGPRMVGIKDNEIRRIDDVYVYYVTDTTPGSSGSPVFDRNMRIIALYHAGGRPLVENGKKFVENVGVRIELVIAAVRDYVFASVTDL